MKLPSSWPPPPHLIGKKALGLRIGMVRGADGRAAAGSGGNSEDLPFTVVDDVAPYVTRGKRAATGEGVWADLEPDYLAPDDDGNAVYIEGHGFVRDRLATLGVTKEQWDALPATRHRLVVNAVRAIRETEIVLLALVNSTHKPVTAAAAKFFIKLLKAIGREKTSKRGLKSEKERGRDFVRAKRLRAMLAILLGGVKDEETRDPRGSFRNNDWCAGKADQINRALAARNLVEACKAADVKILSSSEPLDVATRIASRAMKIPESTLRYEQLRYRITRPKGPIST